MSEIQQLRIISNDDGSGTYPRAAIILGRDVFAFRRPISVSSIIERRSEISARNLLNALFVFAIAIGFVFLLYELWQFQSDGRELIELLSMRTPSLTVFSISLLFVCAIIARFGRMKDSQMVIPDIEKETFLRPAPQATWEDIVPGISSAIDISDFFTSDAMHVFEDGFLLAKRLGHFSCTPAHILASMLAHEECRIVFFRLGISLDDVQKRLSSVMVRQIKGETTLQGATERLAIHAFLSAAKDDMRHVTTLHLLAALAAEEHDAYQVLYDLGIDAVMLTNTVQWVFFDRASHTEYQTWRTLALKKPKGAMNRSYTAIATPLLDSFSRDLTQSARAGALQPCIDREEVFDQIFRVFQSGRSGVLLTGFPGVGKRSIVEGLAARMASEEVPEILQDKRFVELSIPSLVGSAGKQGELEEQFLRLFNEIIRSGNVVLFIENIESLVGLSTESSRNLDALSFLVQTAERYQIPIIATTNPIAYRESIEKTALMSLLQRVEVREVEANDAIIILEGRLGYTEAKHQVYFTYGAVAKAVQLSSRYLHEQYLPEKAIVLLEEVAPYVASSRGKHSIVVGEDVAAIVAQRAHVPVTQVTEKESAKLMRLEEEMHKRVVGQDEAVTMVASALRRARAELRDMKRPISTFLFLGPTGVGKTELAKTVAQVYFGNENNMIRLDMSEYQDPTSISRMIGSPNNSNGGQLTEAIRTKPFSLLLLDEIEKAHPDILNVFLQVMDDGRLTDSLGRTIDFTNTIIIATSNAGGDFIQQQIKAHLPVEEIQKQLVNEKLREHFRPEFLNRFDGVIVFKPLTFEEIKQIVSLMLAGLQMQLSQKGITLKASDAAITELATIGFDPVFGARPLRRTIQERVDNALAKALLTGTVGRRDVAVLEPGGSIRIEKAVRM